MKTEPLPVTKMESQGSAFPACTSMLRSTLLLFFLAFPVYFMVLASHEGGHALHTLAVGGRVSLFYIHPFPMAGYSRPPVEYFENVWFHAAGPALGLLVSLLIFLLFWKRRSASFLPLVMLFPMAAIGQGFVMLMVMGDFTNIVLLSGLSPIIFRVTGSILALVAVFFFVSLFPLLGLTSRDLRSLFVVPAAFFLWALVGLIVGTLVVPGSPADVVHGLGEEILTIAKISLTFYSITGAVLAGIYITLYRWAFTKLPAWLRTETATLAWKDLCLPAVLAAISVFVGLIIIT